MRRSRVCASLVLAAAVASAVRAQSPTGDYVLEVGASKTTERDDFRETHVNGGFRLRVPRLGLLIRGENLLLLNDLEGTRGVVDRRTTGGLPTRGIDPPSARRRLSSAEVRARLERTLRAVGRADGVDIEPADEELLDLFRYLYCEGEVVVVQEGVEVVRCDRLWIAPTDDRIVVENAELRYITDSAAGEQTLVVRGPRLVKQGPRWIGNDVVLTTCTAAEPHAALAVGEVEIIERDGEFEVVTRGQTLQLGGTNVLPLPDARIFTGSQSEFPIKSVTAGYSSNLGAQLGVVVGLPYNQAGGAMHEWLTGRPAQEFRGEWELGVGWIEKRGFPLEGALSYRVDGLYEGRTEGFFLDDSGVNLREITTNVDGSPINDSYRSVLRTQNRVFLGENTHLDLVAFHGSDAAVYSEFFLQPYRTEEVPETSTYLHHADGNHLLTIGARFNLSDFSYRDDRALATRFVEELPVLTYQWLAQPIGETPWQTPIVLDLETQLGQRRSDWDDRAGTRVSDRVFRADQHVELSTPFHWGPINVRPYASGRGTFYDRTVNGGSEERIAFEGGVQFGTRMSRTWRWLDGEDRRAVRHVIAPRVTYRNRFHVDDQPGSFFQFDNVNPRRLTQLGYDQIDTLSERELVRVEVRNLVQQMTKSGPGDEAAPRDFVFLDIGQDIFPDKGRDNAGDTLGLFFYDLLLRPEVQWLPFDDFAFAFYGDHDWKRGMRTLDTELQFGRVLGVNWTVEYRRDNLTDGAVAVSGSARLLDRWNVFAGSQRDLQRDEWLAYSFGLRRDDHDWSILLSAVYNPFVDETTLRIEFLPRFGRMGQPRRSNFGGAAVRDQFSFDY